MLRYGFFDSEIVGYDEEGMPKFDRAESSDFLAMFISQIISDGVLAAPGDCFQVVASEGMVLKVRPGFGIIRGRFAADTKEAEIEIPKAPTSYKRIDRVVLRVNYIQRLCEIVVKTGTPDATPAPPELLQPASGDYYELCLATVAINSNQTVITQSHITDTRYDSSVCGLVTQVIDHLDTSVFYAQLNQFYSEFVDRSDDSYNSFVQSMNSYLENLSESGDQQLEAIVNILNAFEVKSENDFNAWFQNLKDILDEDAAGNLQLEIEALQERCTELEAENESLYAQLRETTEMLIMGNIITTILDADGLVLVDNDGAALVNLGKIHII